MVPARYSGLFSTSVVNNAASQDSGGPTRRPDHVLGWVPGRSGALLDHFEQGTLAHRLGTRLRRGFRRGMLRQIRVAQRLQLAFADLADLLRISRMATATSRAVSRWTLSM